MTPSHVFDVLHHLHERSLAHLSDSPSRDVSKMGSEQNIKGVSDRVYQIHEYFEKVVLSVPRSFGGIVVPYPSDTTLNAGYAERTCRIIE